MHLKKAPDSEYSSTAPADDAGGAGAPEITDEMIDAGTDVLIESGYLAFDRRDGVRLLMRAILSACLSRARF